MKHIITCFRFESYFPFLAVFLISALQLYFSVFYNEREMSKLYKYILKSEYTSHLFISQKNYVINILETKASNEYTLGK